MAEIKMAWLTSDEKELQPLDLIGKTVLLDVAQALEEWKIPGRSLGPRSTEVKERTISFYLDVLLELELFTPARHWRSGAQPASRALAHFEVTNLLGAGLRWRLLWYRALVEQDNQFKLPLLQYVVVAGDVPLENRVRSVGQGWYGWLQPCTIRVFYIDELPFHRWSESDPANPYLRILAIMSIMLEGGDPIPAVRAAVRALLEWSGEHWRPMQLLRAVAERNGLKRVVVEIALEESEETMTSEQPYTKEEFQRDILPWFESPILGPALNELLVEPARREGYREAERMWRSEKHQMLVSLLLLALRVNSIHLPEWQKIALRELPCESLPPIEVAEQAIDADDFAEKAGLRRKLNGGGDGHE